MQIYTTEDLQKILKISQKQANGLMRADKFPSVKIGREYRVSEEALIKWMEKTKEVNLRY